MTIRSTASPFVLAAAAAFALSSSAFAQTMVGSQEVSEEDMASVEAHCAALSADAGSGVTGGTDTTATDDTASTMDDAAAPGGAASGGMAAGGDAAAGSAAGTTDTTAGGSAGSDTDAAAGATGMASLDLEAITAEDCEAAGLTTQ